MKLPIYSKVFLSVFLFYILLGMHIVLPTPGGSGLYLAPNIIGWIFISVFITIGLGQIVKNRLFTYNATLIYAALGCLFLFLPVFYDFPFTSHAIPRLIALLGGLLFFIALLQCRFTAKEKSTLLLLLLLGIAIEAFIGLCQLYILEPFNIQIVGYTPTQGRPYGTFIQPNVMASFMATGIALCLFLVTTKSKLLRYQKAAINFCLFSCSLLLVCLQSKTGYLALLFVIILLSPILYKRFEHYKKSLLLITLGLCVGVLTLMYLQSFNRGAELYQDKNRMAALSVSTALAVEKPIEGQGYGSFQRKYLEAHNEKQKQRPEIKDPEKNLTHPHNEILFWLLEGGAVALIGLILFSFGYLRLFTNPKEILLKLSLLSLITPIFIHTQTEYPFYHSVIHWLYFITFIWLTSEYLGETREKRVQYTLLIKVIAILIPLLTIPFMLTTLHTSKVMDEFRTNKFNDIDYYHQLINKVSWHDYIDIMLHNRSFTIGLEQKSVAILTEYIEWGMTRVSYMPNDMIFRNMIVAVIVLENIGNPIELQKKNKIMAEAKMLFPHITWPHRRIQEQTD